MDGPLDIKNNQRVVCDLCNAECECLQTLKKHKLEKHKDGKLHCCFYCDYKNLALENLKGMALPVMEFQDQGYKIGKIFA